MGAYFAAALNTMLPDAVERAGIATVHVLDQATLAGSLGNSRLWLSVESALLEQVTAYAHRLMERLSKHEPQTGVVEISDFDAAIASVREYADRCAAMHWERQEGGKVFGQKQRAIDQVRLSRVTDDAVNVIEATKQVFASKLAAGGDDTMTVNADEFFAKLENMGVDEVELALAQQRFNAEKVRLANLWLKRKVQEKASANVPTRSQSQHLKSIADEMQDVTEKFVTVFGTLQLQSQDEANFLAMLSDARASAREYLGPTHEFVRELGNVASEIGETPTVAQVHRAIATVKRAASYLSSRPRVPNDKSAIAAMSMGELLETASEETRQAALGKTNFETPTVDEIELAELTKIYLGDKQVAPTPANEVVQSQPKNKKVFLVHGHEHGTRETVARYIEKLGLKPVILDEQANRGKTIIEKLEGHSDVGFAVVLLTPDDEGRSIKDKEARKKPQGRARQNVLLELGYFIGKLGRDNCCALSKGPIEIPSDLGGVLHEPIDDGGGWKAKLARELDAAGYELDWKAVGLAR